MFIHGGAYDRITFSFTSNSDYHHWQAIILCLSLLSSNASYNSQNIALLIPIIAVAADEVKIRILDTQRCRNSRIRRYHHPGQQRNQVQSHRSRTNHSRRLVSGRDLIQSPCYAPDHRIQAWRLEDQRCNLWGGRNRSRSAGYDE